jgi:GNAT superfamily N-acetyltransferase
MEPDDVGRVVEISMAAFDVDNSEAEVHEWFRARVEHLMQLDIDGAFVAQRGAQILGAAQAMIRDELWCLSILVVEPSGQSSGAGRALLRRALDYGSTGRSGLIVSSNDPRAIRLYASAGFAVLPTLQATGPIDRAALPPADARVSEGSANDLEALEAISREVRGGTHTPELELVLAHGGRLLRFGDRGFVVAHARHGVWLLIARDDEAATALLWSALAHTDDGPGQAIRWLTGGQDWAVDVAVRARMRVTAYGALCVRDQPGPLRPFIPSGPFA